VDRTNVRQARIDGDARRGVPLKGIAIERLIGGQLGERKVR